MMPIKHAAHFLNGAAFKPSDWGDTGLPILRIAQLTGKPFDNYFDGKINRGFLIQDGDLLFSWSATIDAFIWDRGNAILNQHIFKVLPQKNALKKYLYYVIKAHAPRWADDDAHGSTMRHIKKESLSNKVWIPDLETQRLIATFLDRETARIDQLIEKKQRLVDVLKERLLSELERLTTPEESLHSEFVPFRWICRITEGQVDPTAPEWADKPLIAPNHIESRTGRLIAIETAEEQGAISGKYAFPSGTVVYSKIRPNLAKACVSPIAGMCSADMYPILPNKSLRSQFLLMQLLSAKFTDWAALESMRVAMPKINRETLGAYRFWVPKLAVQDQAIRRFSSEQRTIEHVSDKVRVSIDQMREFRSSLITAAVTGQIDLATLSKSGQTNRHLDQIEEAT